MVKALAAGAVLIAAALPMAFASAASAATAPSVVTGAFDTTTALNSAGSITATSITSPSVSLIAVTAATYAAGDLVVVGTTVIGTLASSVTTTSGTVTATLVSNASTLESSAAVLIYAPVSIGEGTLATPTITILGTGFAYDGGKVSIASSDPDLSFATVTESSATSLTAVMSATASTTSGSESITVTDDNGASNALAGAITVNPDPTVSAISPATLADSQASGLITVTGNFVGATGTEKVALTDVANNTALEVGPALADLGGTNNTGTYVPTTTGTNIPYSVDQGVPASVSTTSITFYAAALNDVTLGAATAGLYSLTVTNADGGPVTVVGDFTVTAAGITNVSPSSVALSTTAEALTINGYGFQSPTVALGSNCPAGASLVTSATNEISPTDIAIEVTTGTAVGQCTVTVTNTGNGAVFVATDALGIGEAGDANATVTAASVSPAVAIVAGSTTSTPVTLTVTGTGFSPYSTVTVLTGTGSTTATGVTASPCVSSLNGDTLTCTVAVGSGASASTDGIEVNSGLSTTTPPQTGTSGAFEGALSVAGPAITSASPAALAVGAPEGTVVTLTGTGFNSTATATATGSGLVSGDYVFAETSPTTATLTLTAPLPVGSSSIVIVLSETVATGITVSAAPFTLKVDARPTVSALVNTVTKVDGVGAGAVNASVTITGTGFATGATITKFVSAYGVADAGASGTVVSVNAAGTQIVADITLPAADANISDGYTITNTDGGTATAAAFTAAGINIDAGPTITSVSPAAATANSSVAFTITGTGFVTGAAVKASQPDGTCGAATVVSATSITVSCTFLAASTTATSLVVTNPDGGSATSAAVLPAAASTTAPGPKSPHATHVHGSAVTGKTVTITISGTGFYGAPKITSNAKGTTAKVSHDTGKLLTVRISTKAGKGEHTLTIRDADGKSCKINYATK
jgi:hypothetical protein